MAVDDLVLKHYSNTEVLHEIARFSAGRWVAVFSADGMHRYHQNTRRFLRIETVSDVEMILRQLKPRSFYATIHRYVWGAGYPLRMVSTMASWDIDLLPSSSWTNAIQSAEEIIMELNRLGICKSIIVKWSGEGVHIHVNDKAFSQELLARIPPMDAAYALTEYVLKRVGRRPHVLIENKVDSARVFTSPLSLHKALDRVCVCIDPSSLDSFSIDDTRPGFYRHFKGWNKHEYGEADAAVEKAFEIVGGYTVRGKRRRKPSVEEIVRSFHAKFGHGDAPTG